MTSIGTSHGSITVINAMPCGIGATIGVDLRTEAEFTEGGSCRTVSISNDPTEDTNMASICVRRAYERAGLPEPEGWTLGIDSEIPVSRGLKSSSAACNAILRAVFREIGQDMDAVDLIRLGVQCAREAKVTVTGSFDDACGCGLGGIVMTDNREDTILDRRDIGEFDVVIAVPRFKIRKSTMPLERLHSVAPQMREAIGMAMEEPFRAMTANGRIISSVQGVDNSVAEKAMELGALGAGMSGSGPAVAIVVERDEGRDFAERMGLESMDIIFTVTRCGQ